MSRTELGEMAFNAANAFCKRKELDADKDLVAHQSYFAGFKAGHTRAERAAEETTQGAVTDYWLKFYADEHCTLCGNRGIIDSRGIKTPAGVEVGRLNWCLCPNGQALRRDSKTNAVGK